MYGGRGKHHRNGIRPTLSVLPYELAFGRLIDCKRLSPALEKMRRSLSGPCQHVSSVACLSSAGSEDEKERKEKVSATHHTCQVV